MKQCSGTQLTIHKDALIEQLKELPNIKDIKIDIAMPGEKKRIIPVKDVIQPRVKVKGDGKGFPGVTSGIAQMGDGVVKSLDEVAVVTIGDIVGFQEGIIEMWGEGAKWTPFSKTKNIVVNITPVDGLHPHEHEETVRIAGLTAAEIIGEAARETACSESEYMNLERLKKKRKNILIYRKLLMLKC